MKRLTAGKDNSTILLRMRVFYENRKAEERRKGLWA